MTPRPALLLLLMFLTSADSGICQTKASLSDVFRANKIQKIAFSAGQWKFGFGRVLVYEIYEMTADNPSAKLIEPDNSSSPAWSPDGSKLAFSSAKNLDPTQLFVA